MAAFHPMMSPHGAFAEYAVAPGDTVFKLPEGVSFEGTFLDLICLILWREERGECLGELV